MANQHDQNASHLDTAIPSHRHISQTTFYTPLKFYILASSVSMVLSPELVLPKKVDSRVECLASDELQKNL